MSRLLKISYGEAEAEKVRDATRNRVIKRDYGTIYTKDRNAAKLGPVGIGSYPKGPLTPEVKAQFDAVPKNVFNKIYMEGDTYPTLKKAYGMDELSPRGRKALNMTALGHEFDEVRNLGNAATPRTALAAGYGHHSISQILGAESNRLATASDAPTRAGGKALEEIRKKRGEDKVYNNVLALRDKDGVAHYRYGRDRVNRSHRKALYSKEINMKPFVGLGLVDSMQRGERLDREGRKLKGERGAVNGFKQQLHSQDAYLNAPATPTKPTTISTRIKNMLKGLMR